MSFGRRLERLAAARATSAPAAAVSSDVAHSGRLEELRRHLREALARDAPPPRESGSGTAAPLPLSALPFERRETPAGAIYSRIRHVSPGCKVGRLPVCSAAVASPRMLSRLALDPALESCPVSGWLFFDTETTGLGGASTLAFVVGMAGVEVGGGAWVEQLLLARPADEAALLARVAARMRACTALVSFNGKAFDRPLLDTRTVMNRLPALEPRPHLDLLHVGRRLHRARLGRCSLVRLESGVLGFERGPDLDGSEVPARYLEFLRSGDARGLLDVAQHNFWDMLSMLGLVGLYGQTSPRLDARDLTGLARTLGRAGAREEARSAALAAWERGGGGEALRALAELAKARGDAREAIQYFERLCANRSDPSAHLSLAKLYEHALRDPATALDWVSRGTEEEHRDDQRRRSRLEGKIGKLSWTGT